MWRLLGVGEIHWVDRRVGAWQEGICGLLSSILDFFQEFAISKNIQLGDEKGLKFPSVWDWSLQHTARDRMLFHNPLYIGKSTPCVHNGAVKSFKRTKVRTRKGLSRLLPLSCTLAPEVVTALLLAL